MGAVWLASMPQVVAKAGVDIELFEGYETRSRSTGGLIAAWGIGHHHDGIGASVPEINRSRAGWTNTTNPNRPVGNVRITRTGLWVIGALGATNTQGRGPALRMSKGVVPENMANHYFVSLEPSNDGLGQPWTLDQQESIVTGSAALMLWLGLQPGDNMAHFETAPGRKVDPAGPSQFAPNGGIWNMDQFRGAVWFRSMELVEKGLAWGSAKPAPALPAPKPSTAPFDPANRVYGDWPKDLYLPTLRNGSRGDTVRFLQGVLKHEANRKALVVDGNFGNQTQRELEAVQAFFDLPADGICGWGGPDRLGVNPGPGATWPIVQYMAAKSTPTPAPAPVVKPPAPAPAPAPAPKPAPAPAPVAKFETVTPLRYFVRKGDNPWAVGERIYASGKKGNQLLPLERFAKPYVLIDIPQTSGVRTTVQDGEGPLVILDRLGIPRSELPAFQAWNGGASRTLHPGDAVHMPR